MPCLYGTMYTNTFRAHEPPDYFQRALDLIVTAYKWNTCLVYLDDVIISSRNVDYHIKHVEEIIKTIEDAGVTLSIKKCHCFHRQVEYLGHMDKPDQLEINKTSVETLRKSQAPSNKTKLRSFLGLCKVYRRFIDYFIWMSNPPNKMLKSGTPDTLQLDDEQWDLFKTVINKVCSPPVLALLKAGLQ